MWIVYKLTLNVRLWFISIGDFTQEIERFPFVHKKYHNFYCEIVVYEGPGLYDDGGFLDWSHPLTLI